MEDSFSSRYHWSFYASFQRRIHASFYPIAFVTSILERTVIFSSSNFEPTVTYRPNRHSRRSAASDHRSQRKVREESVWQKGRQVKWLCLTISPSRTHPRS